MTARRPGRDDPATVARRRRRRQRHLRPVGRLAAGAAPPRHPVRGRRPARRPQPHGRRRRRRRRASPVDTGFIVYNEADLSEPDGPVRAPRRRRRRPSEMSFAVSLDDGALEYSGTDLRGLFAQRGNLRQPALLVDAARPGPLLPPGAASTPPRVGLMPLDDYLDRARLRPRLPRRPPLPDGGGDLVDAGGADRPLSDRGLRPLLREPPAAARSATGRPGARSAAAAASMSSGSRAALGDRVRIGSAAVEVRRDARRRRRSCTRRRRGAERFDQVVIATHADQALRLLPDAERRRAAPARRLPLQPQPRGAAQRPGADAAAPRRLVELELRRRPQPRRDALCVTYWMNRLQGIDDATAAVPHAQPDARAARRSSCIRTEIYEHPLLRRRGDPRAGRALVAAGRAPHLVLRRLLRLRLPRGRPAGGLAVAEALGGVRRPWTRRGRIGAHPPAARSRGRATAERGDRIGRAPRRSTSARVMHQRLRPARHRLRYRMFSLLLDLDELPRAGAAAAPVLAQPLQPLQPARARPRRRRARGGLRAQVERQLRDGRPAAPAARSAC